MSKAVIPPTWKFEGSAGENLKKLLIAQMIGFAGHKGILKKHLDVIAPPTIVNGKLVYQYSIELLNKTIDHSSTESMFLKTIVGMDDAGLTSIASASIDANHIWFNWRRRFAFEKQDWQNGMQAIRDAMANVSSIEVYSTMVSYYSLQKMNNQDYIIANASGSLAGRTAYDSASTGFTYQDLDAEILYTKLSPTVADWDSGTANALLRLMTEADRIPLAINYNNNTPFTPDAIRYISGVGIENRDDENGLPTSITTIVRKNYFSMAGNYLPTMIFKDSGGTNITSTMPEDLQRTVLSILLLSGSAFMSTDGITYKNGEILTDNTLSYIVTGKQTFTGLVKQTFIDDIDDINWFAYTQADVSTRYFPTVYGGDESEYEYYYGQHFWYYRDNNVNEANIDVLTDGMFMYYNGVTYLTVDGLAKSTDKQYGRWIFALANINVTYPSSGVLSIGGFLGDFLSTLVKAVIGLLDAIINVFKEIAELTLKITGIYYMITAVGLEDYIDLITEIMAHIALAVVTLGVSEYVSLAYSGVVMTEVGISEVAYLATEHLLESGIANIIVKTVGAIGGGISGESSNRAEEKQERRERESQSDKELEDALEEYKSLSGDKESSNQSNKELINELNFNPFKRLEVKEKMKYDSYNSFDKLDPYKRILN